MTATKTTSVTAFERLEELRKAAREVHREVAEQEMEAKGAGRRLEAAQRALQQYLAGVAAGAKSDPKQEEALRAELAKVEARTHTVHDWTQGVQTAKVIDFEAEARAEAARLAAEDADAAVGAFVAENRDELAEELRESAHAARDDLLRSISALSESYGRWQAVRRAWIEDLHVPPAELPLPPIPGHALQEVELVAAQVEGGAKDPRGALPAPVEPEGDEEVAPSPGSLRGWQRVPQVISSASGLGA